MIKTEFVDRLTDLANLPADVHQVVFEGVVYNEVCPDQITEHLNEAMGAIDPDEHGAFETLVQKMKATFNEVAPKDNWKFAIDHKYGEAFWMTEVGAAIRYFTGSRTFVCVDQWRVIAAGYYATIGS